MTIKKQPPERSLFSQLIMQEKDPNRVDWYALLTLIAYQLLVVIILTLMFIAPIISFWIYGLEIR